MPKPQILIRPIELSDAEAAATLSGELGYPLSADTMAGRIRDLPALTNHAVFVASSSDIVVGWIDVGIVNHLQAEPYGEIGGLVVSHDFRGRGAGRQLVAAAEQWTASRGVRKMLVRSQVHREAAHEFYVRQDFLHSKTSAVFTKPISTVTEASFSPGNS